MERKYWGLFMNPNSKLAIFEKKEIIHQPLPPGQEFRLVLGKRYTF